MNSNNAMFDHERPEFLIQHLDLSVRTYLGVEPAANFFTTGVMQRTRMGANRIRREWLIGRTWRQFLQIEL